jgi:hypothetical protein
MGMGALAVQVKPHADGFTAFAGKLDVGGKAVLLIKSQHARVMFNIGINREEAGGAVMEGRRGQGVSVAIQTAFRSCWPVWPVITFVKSPVFKPRRKSLPGFVRFRFEQGFSL